MQRHLNLLKQAMLFGLILVAALQARAANDILIIDVNNVVPEIDYIRNFIKQEQAEGRELDTQIVIVPSENRIPMETRRHIQDLHLRLIDPNAKFYQDNCTVSAMERSPSLKENCEKRIAIANRARKEVLPFLKGTRMDGGLTIEDIEEELEEALRGPYRFSRVIISGHHGPDGGRGLLSGELFAGFGSDLAKRVMNAAPSTQNVRSLIMLGCWTGMPEMLKNAWGEVLPQAQFRSGFVEKAPAKVNPTNLVILDSLLRYEKSIGEAQNISELRERYSKLKTPGRKVAVKVRNNYFSEHSR